MFSRQERTAILLLLIVAAAVIAAHLILSGLGKQPFAHPFSASSADGELVVIQGQVDQISLTKSGGNLVVSVDNISLFLPSQAAEGLDLQKGDSVMAYGVVQTYQGKKEVVVDSARDIRVV